jgi:D-beta-D-heptose 7-phosphate kinase/D-beta-D-heptose 1-phosphate adenosyltransferase
MNDSPAVEAALPKPEADLLAAVRLLGRTSVLVVGDVMLDRYVYGQVERISPEAPVPILAIDRELAIPGGAGNVVRNLTALGAAVAFISVVGDDQAGSDLTALIGGQPNIEPWLLVQGGRITTLKTRYLSAGQQLLRADREETSPVQPRLAERLLRIARDAMAATSITVLSDYQKGLMTGGLPTLLIAAAREAGRPIIVDPKGPLCGRRRRHAEPDRSGRGDRHASGYRGSDRCRRHRASPAPWLRRRAGDARQ